MLSILIPTYNFDITALVSAVHKQAIELNIPFELLCFDDASTNPTIVSANTAINNLEHSSYTVLESNIGRSKIRNLLASKATYDWLLFLDADVIPVDVNLISRYIEAITPQSQIIYGGILYKEELPHTDQRLRWVYGKKREALTKEQRDLDPYLRFLTLNFIIHKSVFDLVKFNEDIPNLRHEDTLFGTDLKQANISISHIANPVYHLGLETSEVFLKKSLESVDALLQFINTGLVSPSETLISRVHANIKKLHLDKLMKHLYANTKARRLFEKQLHSQTPSLLVFDLYRLCYLCYLDQ